jgi:hypothetical protein
VVISWEVKVVCDSVVFSDLDGMMIEVVRYFVNLE